MALLLARLLPILLVTLTFGCIAGATGEEEPPQSAAPAGASGAARASSALVIIATVTPTPQLDANSRLEVAPTLAAETAGATATATEIPAEVQAAHATNTPEPEPTEAAQPDATDTSTATPSATPTETATSSPSPSPTPSPTATPSPTPTPATPTPVPLPGMSSGETYLLTEHNRLRSDLGRPPLQSNSTLMAIARERAHNMASTGSLSHYNPDGTNVFHMMTARGYAYVTGSENIHFNDGFSEQQSLVVAMQEWVASSSHHASIISLSHGRVGIGIATASDGTVYYSVVFSD